MRKKLFFKLFVIAVLGTFVTFTSCKDYDDDIKDLETQVSSLKSTVDEIQQKIENSEATITGVETTANGITITMSDGKSYNITNGADGEDGSVITIGENGNWFIDGEDTNKPSKGDDGEDGVYYTPGEDGFWHKVEDGVETPSSDRWMAEGTITAKWEDGYVVLYNVEGSDDPITIGLVGMNNLIFIPKSITESGESVLNFSTLIKIGDSKTLRAKAKYQVSPTSASEKLIDKENIYFKYNNPEIVTYASELNPQAKFISLEDGILTVTASIDADVFEMLKDNDKKAVQLMLVVPLTSGDEVVSGFVKAISVGVEEIVPSLSVTPENPVMIEAEGDDISIAIDANGDDWDISELPDWLEQKEKTPTAIMLTVAPNEGGERSASVIFHLVDYPSVTKVVEISQEKHVAPSLEVPASEDGLSVAFEGGDVKIAVESNFDWTYNIEEGDWLSEVNKTDNELVLAAVANDGTERKATVVINTESTPALTAEVIITQSSEGVSLNADLLDVVFNLDGTAEDVSPMNHTVKKISHDHPFSISYNEEYERNMAVFNPEQNGKSPGEDKGSYYRIDYAADSDFHNKLKTGHTFETLVKFDVDYANEQKYETKFFSTQEQGGTGFLVANWNQSTGENGLTFLPNIATTEGGGSRWIWANSKIKPNGSSWYHLVGVWDKEAGKAYLYVNGEKKAEVDAEGFYRPINLSEPWVAIGGDAGNNQVQGLFKGSIAIARIYDKALTEVEAKTLWDNIPEVSGQGSGEAPSLPPVNW